MNAFEAASWRAAVIGRWTARISGTLMFLLFLAFLFGEGPPHLSRLTTTEHLQALGVGAVFVGLPIAWKWEGLGGLVTVAGFGFLAAISSTYLHLWAFCLPALAGAVHLASWGRLRMVAPAGPVAWHMPRSVVVSLLAALAGFLLLCANEIFGQPPLMTSSLRPDSSLGGSWHGVGSISVEIFIHSDGSVTGTIGETAITDGRIMHGRSWFGRLMHINSPYTVVGEIAGNRFTVPLQFSGGALDGAVFLRNLPMHVRFIRQQP